MSNVEYRDFDWEFRRVTRSLDLHRRPADWQTMPKDDSGATQPATLTQTRVLAVIGLALAMAAVVVAFTVHWTLGIVAVLLTPAVPLSLVVVADRLRRMAI